MIDAAFNENGTVEPSYVPDVAMEIDSIEDTLRQIFRENGWTGVVAWHANEIDRESHAAVAKRTAQIVAFLFQPCRNVRAKILGLMFSSELATRLNGVRNVSDQARKDGVSRALISHYARQWDKTFGYKISQAFGKSPAACAKYREARLRFLSRSKK